MINRQQKWAVIIGATTMMIVVFMARSNPNLPLAETFLIPIGVGLMAWAVMAESSKLNSENKTQTHDKNSQG